MKIGRFKATDLSTVMRQAFTNFKQNDPLRLAGSTAFFATFALPAILVVILRIFGIFLNRKQFGVNIIQKLQQLVGESSAREIRDILLNLLRMNDGGISTLLLFLFLIFVSTTLFVIIRNSINQLWSIRVQKHLGFSFHAMQRLKSLAIISTGGILMLIVFVLEGIRLFLEKRIDITVPYVSGFLNEVIFFSITSIWFCIMFRFIANGHPARKSVYFSGMFTGLLFTIGKVIMRSILLNSNISEIYGTSGAILLVMLFVFYSSFIMYYGACLVNSISTFMGMPISASAKAYKYRFEEISADE